MEFTLNRAQKRQLKKIYDKIPDVSGNCYDSCKVKCCYGEKIEMTAIEFLYMIKNTSLEKLEKAMNREPVIAKDNSEACLFLNIDGDETPQCDVYDNRPWVCRACGYREEVKRCRLPYLEDYRTGTKQNKKEKEIINVNARLNLPKEYSGKLPMKKWLALWEENTTSCQEDS